MSKMFAVLIGFILGGFPGALIGFFLASMLGRSAFLGGLGGGDREAAQDQYFHTVFTLMGHLAKSDGRISEAEIAAAQQLMQRMGLTAEHRKQAIAFFKDGAAPEFDLQAELLQFRHRCGRKPNLMNMLLVTLIGIAFADQKLHPSERDILENVAAQLGFNRAHFEQVLGMVAAQQGFATGGGFYQQSQQNSQQGSQQQSQGQYYRPEPRNQIAVAYQALGIEATASDKEVKRAYRKLMSQNHPDKLIAQGLPDDMIELATEKTQEIQRAYELLKDQRGMK